MTTNNPGDNDIDTLALRAKEMLDRVRGASTYDDTDDTADSTSVTDAKAEASVDSATKSAALEDSQDVDQTNDDLAIDEAADAEVEQETATDEDAEIEDATVEELDVAEIDIEDATVEEISIEEISAEELDEDSAIAATGFEDLLNETDVATNDTLSVDDAAFEELDVAEIDIEDATVEEISAEELDEHSAIAATGFEDPLNETDDTELSVDDLELDNFADEPAADIVDDADIAEDIEVDESTTTEFSFGGREADAERVPEGEDLSLSIEDETLSIDDLADDAPDSPSQFDSVSFADILDKPSISTDDLVAEIEDLDATPTVAGMNFDTDTVTDEVQAPVGESGASIVTGAAAASTAASTAASDRAKVKVRDRGRLSDLDSREQPPPAFNQPSGHTRRANVDHDLNELFLKGGNNANQAKLGRSFGWFLPLVVLALFVLGFLVWAANQTGSDEPETNAAQSESAEVTTAPTTVATPDTVSEEAATAPTTDAATTTEAAPTTTEAETFETAWQLIGDASNTGAFGAFAGPLGLQAALEQQVVDADGNPTRFTLLAPSDSAVANLTQEQLDALSADPESARQLFEYHIIDTELTPEFLLEDLENGQILSRSGVPIFVEREDGEVIFNGNARIELAGLEAENGSILVIDSVLSPPTVNEILDLGNITFAVLSSRITPEGQAELQRAVTYFNDNPDQSASIEGHTDTDGEADANLGLSQRRADSVRQFLIDNGIAAERLVAQGFGEEVPVIVDGVENKDASRRIEFVLQ